MRSFSLASIAIFCSMASFAPGQSALDFSPTATILRTDAMDLVAYGQILGSPTPDLVLSSGFDLSIVDGDHPSGAAPVVVLALTFALTTVDLVDVDGDGDTDIVDTSYQEELRVRVQNGGAFATQSYSLMGSEGLRPRFGDYDDDGLSDISYGRFIFLGQPGGLYVATNSPLPPNSASAITLIARDLDGDGDTDIHASYDDGSLPQVTSQNFKRLANGTLQAGSVQVLASQGNAVVGFEDADFDGNGKPDFIVMTYSPSNDRLRLRRLEAPTAGGFQTRQDISIGLDASTPTSNIAFGRLVIRDIDGDGDLDGALDACEESSSDPFGILLEGQAGGNIDFHEGFGLSLLSGANPWYFDFDQDGASEIVFVDDSTGTLRSSEAGSLGVVPTLVQTSTQPGGIIPTSPATPVYLIGTSVTITTTWTAIVPSRPPIPVRGRVITRSLATTGAAPTFVEPSNIAKRITGDLGQTHSKIASSTAAGAATLSAEGFTLGTARFGGQVEPVAGPVQSLPSCVLDDAGIGIRVTGTDGAPIAGILVNLMDTPSGTVVWDAIAVHTDGAGIATFRGATANGITAGVALTFNAGGIGMTAVALTITPSAEVLANFSGNGQFTNFGSAFAAPFVVRLTSGTGAPIAGAPIDFAITGPVTATSALSTITDAGGFAHVTLTTTNGGPVSIVATRPSSPSCGTLQTTLSAFVRHLSSSLTTNFMNVFYRHEHPGIPLLFAVDAPRPPIVQSYGTLYTSVLAPGPNFGFLDGLGVIGSGDPLIVTNGSGVWNRGFLLTPAITGISIVMQVYGVDGAYPFPSNIIVSNPVTVTF